MSTASQISTQKAEMFIIFDWKFSILSVTEISQTVMHRIANFSELLFLIILQCLLQTLSKTFIYGSSVLALYHSLQHFQRRIIAQLTYMYNVINLFMLFVFIGIGLCVKVVFHNQKCNKCIITVNTLFLKFLDSDLI